MMSSLVEQVKVQTQILQMQDIPRDCEDLLSRGGQFSSASYTIRAWETSSESFRASCDLDTDGSAWMVIQKRFDGSENFNRGWSDYVQGFGSADWEYWIGLERIWRLTRFGTLTLRIDLEDFAGNTAYAEYKSFNVGDADTKYRLSIGSFNGTAGDSLTSWDNNQSFSTKDSDNDNSPGYSCANHHHGAWWFVRCGYANLNAQYFGDSRIDETGMTWNRWKQTWEVLKKSEMKIRRTQ